MRFIYLFLMLIPLSVIGQTGNEYADLITEAYLHPKHSKLTYFYGGFGRMFPIEVKPEVALGNNKYFISLPKGSYLVVKFTDNEIIDSPNKDDIFVSEVGCSDEHANVYVSNDGENFTFLGVVDDCDVSSLDLATIEYSLPVKYIKIEGLDSKGGSPGFDLVSIKGLPGANKATFSTVDSIVNNPTTDLEVNKKFIFENVLFESNSAELVDSSLNEIDELISYMKNNETLFVTVIGHTDNIGDSKTNLQLSTDRAESVINYMIQNGITKDRLTYEGHGETMPIKSNNSEEGRQKNRRVEFRISEN